MKKTTMLCGVMMGLSWGHKVDAQPINFGSNNASSQKPLRPMDKEEYADDAKVRWEQLKKSFGERTRIKGPFGTNMEPGVPKVVAPVIETKIEDIIPTKPKKIVPLKDALSKFLPTLISASQQAVMVGPRTMNIGDSVEIEYDGVLFKLRIIKISSGRVEFINTENGEKGIVREYEFNPSQNESADELFDKIKEDKKDILRIK